MLIEICVDSVEGALAAQRGGASRVELCASLVEGGTTPSAGCIRTTRTQLQIDLNIIIRPRGGDFLYSQWEFETMRQDIEFAKNCGANGVVLGCLTPEGDIDLDLTTGLMETARPMSITFHRAFDLCRDADESLKKLIDLGVDCLLTSGQQSSAWSGRRHIAKLRQRAQDAITIMPGGGITPANVRDLVEETGVTAVHLSARSPVGSGMIFRRENIPMGGAPAADEYHRKTTDEQIVHDIVRLLAK